MSILKRIAQAVASDENFPKHPLADLPIPVPEYIVVSRFQSDILRLKGWKTRDEAETWCHFLAHRHLESNPLKVADTQVTDNLGYVSVWLYLD